MKICVLLCTYNGEAYLDALLRSLVNQNYRDYIVCVRDDGSTDRTKEVLQSYFKRYPDCFHDYSDGEHRGYPASLWSLLRDCESADAYAFCDQDDVWNRTKLSCACEVLEQEKQKIRREREERKENTVYLPQRKENNNAPLPLLYIHDYNNCDENLAVQSVHRMPDPAEFTGKDLIFYTMASGFSMVIDDTLRRLLLAENLDILPLFHDEWCIWTAYYHGKIVHDKRILVQYRRHEGTVTTYGGGKKKMTTSWLRDEVFGDEFYNKCNRIRTFLSIDTAIPKNEKELWSLLSGEHKTPIRYFKRLFYPDRLRPTIGGEVALRILFLVH